MDMSDSKPPVVVRTIQNLRMTVSKWRTSGEHIALVPTMGALHDGHLSLVQIAAEHADRTIVSIFVNPTQFGPNEDFDKYPRTENQDVAKLSASAVDVVFAPDSQEMYADGFATTVHVGEVSEGLCGAVRPGHFDGVATIVSKLLLQSAADVAVFGEKDYQQLMVIRRLVKDLNIPTQIVGAPIVRDIDGLAMSSRNQYLSAQQRQVAAQLNTAIKSLIVQLRDGADVDAACNTTFSHLKTIGFDKVDYVEVRDADSLKPWGGDLQNGRVLAAAHLGTTRLIDNMSTAD